MKLVTSVLVLLIGSFSFAGSREISFEEFYSKISNDLDETHQIGAYEGKLDVVDGPCLASTSMNKEKTRLTVFIQTLKKDLIVYFPANAKITEHTDELGDRTYTTAADKSIKVFVPHSQTERSISVGNRYTTLHCQRNSDLH